MNIFDNYMCEEHIPEYSKYIFCSFSSPFAAGTDTKDPFLKIRLLTNGSDLVTSVVQPARGSLQTALPGRDPARRKLMVEAL